MKLDFQLQREIFLSPEKKINYLRLVFNNFKITAQLIKFQHIDLSKKASIFHRTNSKMNSKINALIGRFILLKLVEKTEIPGLLKNSPKYNFRVIIRKN